ncbi:E2 [Gammapapillomavirus sp.]|uniref:E2 n=1 Tax=Gammapapillomavirus sp. TaxID=2049444 RepID=UPI000C5F3A62|nr:E2 [Gammapapillomavirus sp.]ATQ38197.1 E2 [Gammapapillomavirus sp.]
METRETLTARFDALQDQIMTLYEQGNTDLQSQILHWELERKANVLLYYARKENIMSLGLQPTPALQVSEYRSKEAIHIVLLLKSLAKSPFADERWSLADTSAQILFTEPKNCFKKGAFQVEVLFDNDEQNMFPYPNWNHIYYQDAADNWHKTEGRVDYDGCFYEEENGDRVYFRLFEKDAATYGRSGQWTVRFKNTTIFTPVTSSSRSVWPTWEVGESSSNTNAEQESENRRPETPQAQQQSPTSTAVSTRRRRRGGEGESTTDSKRRKFTARSFPTPDQVGRDHRSPNVHGLTRLGVLQAEARDPPLIIVKGGANGLKCWRRRCKLKYSSLYLDSSTVFNWVKQHNDTKSTKSRILVAFKSNEQRSAFLSNVTIPKGCSIAYGNIDSL